MRQMARNTAERQGLGQGYLDRLDRYVLPEVNFAQPLTDAWSRHLPIKDRADWLKETAPYLADHLDHPDAGPYHGGQQLARRAGVAVSTQYTPYYFHSQGGANSRHGNGRLRLDTPAQEPPDAYAYDPRDPVPTRGGNALVIPLGVYDQRPVEERRGVLCYTSDLLTKALEITGPITVTLYAASSAPRTDFTAKLVDVRPDGYARYVADGILRARYRGSRANPSPIRPGVVYEYRLDL